MKRLIFVLVALLTSLNTVAVRGQSTYLPSAII